MPMYTLTMRKGNPDRLELQYAETDYRVTLARTDLEPLIGTWVEVTVTIDYGTMRTYDLRINRISDGTILFDYSNTNMVNWRPGVDFIRSKWGIYRSLNNAQDLRDETVLFAHFSVEELATSSVNSDNITNEIFKVSPNPENDLLNLANLPHKSKQI